MPLSDNLGFLSTLFRDVQRMDKRQVSQEYSDQKIT